MYGHFGPLAGAVNGEEAEAGDFGLEEVVIGVADEFGGALCGGVGRDGVVNGVGFGEGDFFVVAVNGRGGGEDEARDAVLDGGVEEQRGADDVDVAIEGRLGEGGADAGAGGEVDDEVEFSGGEYFVEQRAVADVAFDQRVGGVAEVRGDVFAFDARVVVVVEVVEDGDAGAGGEEAVNEV